MFFYFYMHLTSLLLLYFIFFQGIDKLDWNAKMLDKEIFYQHKKLMPHYFNKVTRNAHLH